MSSEFLIGAALSAVVFAIACGVLAHRKGRDPGMWAFGGSILGIFAFGYLLFVPRDEEELKRRQIAQGNARECPHCKDAIPRNATACRSCGRDVEPVRTAADY